MMQFVNFKKASPFHSSNLKYGMAKNYHCIEKFAAALVLVICVVFVLAPQSGWADAAKPQLFEFDIRNGKVTAAQKTIRVTEGETVHISWTTDKAVELHLHGYDLHAHAAPSKTVTMKFKARVAGRFPISSHGKTHGAMIYLEVHPR
jgi:hypothetical protein